LNPVVAPEWLRFRWVFLALGAAMVAVEALAFRSRPRKWSPTEWILAAWAVLQILVLAAVCWNHADFPLNLLVTEGTVLQHVERAATGSPIYPEPTPSFLPLSYNPLYYFVVVPLTWILGARLVTLRVVSILATAVSGFVLFRAVREATASRWWGLMAVGLFSASYRAMDTNLDSAHPDACLLAAGLLGTWVVAGARSRARNLLGLTLLVAAFWLKQHGALLAVGALVFLTWRDGWRRALPYWGTVVLLGPVAYILAGPALFGPRFHYFTWAMPRGWTEPTLDALVRYARFALVHYGVLAASSLAYVAWLASRRSREITLWHVQLPFAASTGLLGVLDPGSSDNVFIPMAAWLILTGTMGLHALQVEWPLAGRLRAHALALFVAFAALTYDPREVMSSPRAWDSYRDLVGLLRGLHGQVYAPSLGQLQEGFVLYPTPHWVTLEDLIRGPGRDTRDHPDTRRLLEPVLDPAGPAFVLTNYPLGTYSWLAFLGRSYILETDFGDRFRPLRTKPSRWDCGWPRYLYRFAPREAGAPTTGARGPAADTVRRESPGS
jgi:hypothetical protein